jgi:hypothetical protein
MLCLVERAELVKAEKALRRGRRSSR